MIGEHLVEGTHKIRIRLFDRITVSESVQVPSPMPSYPFAIGSAVYRTEYGAIFGRVNRPKPFSGSRRDATSLYRRDKLLREGQLAPAPFADAQVFFDFVQSGV